MQSALMSFVLRTQFAPAHRTNRSCHVLSIKFKHKLYAIIIIIINVL